MFIRNTLTNHEGLWLKTTDSGLVVWNTDTNAREDWPLENTEGIKNQDVPSNDFLELLEHLTSPGIIDLLNESELMRYCIKSIAFYTNAGLFSRGKNVQKMIETIQEVLYYVFGSNRPLGVDRDELILFIHQKVPSLFLGAYWGFKIAKQCDPQVEQEIEEPKQKPKRKSLWYSFCRCRNL